jgi:hypothetical protein
MTKTKELEKIKLAWSVVLQKSEFSHVMIKVFGFQKTFDLAKNFEKN